MQLTTQINNKIIDCSPNGQNGIVVGTSGIQVNNIAR